ncbi:MAG: CPXCG motif-containing cysteine-rich protein [Bdellovibrio sp. CG10_big_fil_rev_8_21_14_0_10_47_8]|nr:MAG: CPXCG motif-containing cysteine-rich protein [Bdellovibrio sp. CG10_big_fil_rev_8_21_14_0_10_47_8]
MEEIEKHFRCPYCLEMISMILDLSVEGEQSYIEDCEVCCHPIQISYTVTNDGQLKGFRKEKT